MGKIKFQVTNFIGVRVEKLRLPPWADSIDLRNKYLDILPELLTIVRPYFYVATSPKEESSYIREMEGIPDFYPLQVYPGRNHDGYATIINMVGLYIEELAENGIEIVEAYDIIEQTLLDIGIEFNPEDIEVLFLVPKISIEPD